jgi:hypothetical protein
MKAKTFPWLLMQNNTFQPNKEMKVFFIFLFECSQRKKEKYQQVKNQEKTYGLIADRKESLQEITLQQLKK